MRHTISSFRHSLFTLCSHPVHLRRPRYLRMNVSRSIALAVLLALTTPALASVQPFDIAQGGPAARQISFADVAAAVVQSNFQLRAAALNIAIAQAQLAQAQGGQMPQATLSGSYTRTQEPPPAFLLNPNIYAAGVAISYPLSTGGRVEAQIALVGDAGALEIPARGLVALLVHLKRGDLAAGRQGPRQVKRRDADRCADLDDPSRTAGQREDVQERPGLGHHDRNMV